MGRAQTARLSSIDLIRAGLLMSPGSMEMPLTRVGSDARPPPESRRQFADRYISTYRERWRNPEGTSADLLALPPRNRVPLVLEDRTARDEVDKAIERRVEG